MNFKIVLLSVVLSIVPYISTPYMSVHFCITIMYNVENYLEKRDVVIILRQNYFSESQSENKNVVTPTSMSETESSKDTVHGGWRKAMRTICTLLLWRKNNEKKKVMFFLDDPPCGLKTCACKCSYIKLEAACWAPACYILTRQISVITRCIAYLKSKIIHALDPNCVQNKHLSLTYTTLTGRSL